MQKDIKFEGANGTKKSAVRHFWAYCAILFSLALILIMIAGYIQTKTLMGLQQETNSKEDIINTKDSALKNVQAINEEQKKTIEKLQKDYEVLIGDTKTTREKLKDAEIETKQLRALSVVQNFYIKNQKKLAREEFSLIKSDEIKAENVRELYDYMKIKLGIK